MKGDKQLDSKPANLDEISKKYKKFSTKQKQVH